MVSEKHFAGLIEAIYAAAADCSRWAPALGLIANTYHARTVVLNMYGPTPDECWTTAPDIEHSVHERYAAYYHAINPIWHRTRDLAPGEVRTDAMIVPRPEFTKTEFFQDFLRPQDIGSMIGVVGHNRDGRMSVVSVQRARPFEAGEVALYRRLAPHVHRAVQLNLRLAQSEMRSAFVVEALDELEPGVLLVDGASRLVFANRAAQQLFIGNDGLRLVGNVLHARSTRETEKLHKLVACCSSRSPHIIAGGSLAISRSLDRPKIALSVTPLRGQDATFGLMPPPVAIILADDPERRRQPTSECIMRRFGMTPKETSLAMEMLAGGTLQACADRLGVTRATAQTHLAHIFQKTGVRRQADLVRLLLKS